MTSKAPLNRRSPRRITALARGELQLQAGLTETLRDRPSLQGLPLGFHLAHLCERLTLSLGKVIGQSYLPLAAWTLRLWRPATDMSSNRLWINDSGRAG